MPAFIRLTKWREYQHYTDRTPPWIKLHRDLLTSRTWVSSSTEDRVLAIACMMLASCTDNSIPLDSAYFKRVAYLDFEPNFGKLLDLQFIEISDENGVVLARCSRDASTLEQMLDQRRGEESIDTPLFPISRTTPTPPEEKQAGPGLGKANGYIGLAREVLAFLNEKTGKAFHPTSTNLDLIIARLREGYTDVQCRQVIARKVREWLPDEKMAGYLRPATLFNREKFNQYAGELVATTEGSAP